MDDPTKRPPFGPNYDFTDCGYDTEDEYRDLQRYLAAKRRGALAFYVASTFAFALIIAALFWSK